MTDSKVQSILPDRLELHTQLVEQQLDPCIFSPEWLENLVHPQAPIILPSPTSKDGSRILPVAWVPASKLPIDEKDLLVIPAGVILSQPSDDVLPLRINPREFWLTGLPA